MEALRGLSALAAVMPRAATDENTRVTSEAADCSIEETPHGISAETWRASKAAAATPKILHDKANDYQASSQSFSLRKRPFDAENILATNSAIVGVRYSSTMTPTAIDEGSLIRMELARRASLAKFLRLNESSSCDIRHNLGSVPVGEASVVTPLPRAHNLFGNNSRHRHPLQLQDYSNPPPLSRGDNNSLRCDAPFLLDTTGSSIHPPRLAVRPRIDVGVGPAISNNAASWAGVLEEAQAQEAQARASWLHAAQNILSAQQERHQQQHQQELLIQDTLQEKIQQEKVRKDKIYPEKLGKDEFYQERELVPVPAGANGLRAKSVISAHEHSMRSGGNAAIQNSKYSQQPPITEALSSPMDSKYSRFVEVEEQKDTNCTTNSVVKSDYPDNANHPRCHKTLYLPTDPYFLSNAHCFVRFTCIEIFVSTEEQVRAPGKGARPLRAGQVGFQCIHCKTLPKASRANQAVCYPSTRDNIFESIRNFHRVHLNACPQMPVEVKRQYAEEVRRRIGPKRSQKLVRAYYAQAASEVGLVDTTQGLGYHKDYEDRSIAYDRGRGGCPSYSDAMRIILHDAQKEEAFWASKNLLSLQSKKKATHASGKSTAASKALKDSVKYGKFESVVSDCTRQVLENARKEATPFVLPGDFANISDHIFLLFHQLRPCKPTAATMKRRRLNFDQINHIPGLCCKHCNQDSGSQGMYFPLAIESLGDSSFSQTLMMHLSTCSYVDSDIKNALIELKGLGKEYNSCAKRGSKKAFIAKVWSRMKGVSSRNEGVLN